MLPPQAKLEQEASAKKRKTEWQAGLASLPGDVQLTKDIRGSLSVCLCTACPRLRDFYFWHGCAMKGNLELPFDVYYIRLGNHYTNVSSCGSCAPAVQDPRSCSGHPRETEELSSRGITSTGQEVWECTYPSNQSDNWFILLLLNNVVNMCYIYIYICVCLCVLYVSL